jgi:hypothetical protein
VIEWPEPSGNDGIPRVNIDADGLYQMALEQRAEELVRAYAASRTQ